MSASAIEAMVMDEDRVTGFLNYIGLKVHPDSLWLYAQALTHSSFTYEYKLPSLDNYERLEFLGDAVLKIIISQYLFRQFPNYREGDLTKIRAVIVSDAVLAKFARMLNLGEAMTFGPSEARNHGPRKTSNLACAFEALLGALYLDNQMDFAMQFVINLMAEEIVKVDQSKTKANYKAVLQELTQQDGDGLPEYKTVKEEGPAHSRFFHIDVLVNGEVLGSGSGRSKKEAQQLAAKRALSCLNHLPADEQDTDTASS